MVYCCVKILVLFKSFLVIEEHIVAVYMNVTPKCFIVKSPLMTK